MPRVALWPAEVSFGEDPETFGIPFDLETDADGRLTVPAGAAPQWLGRRTARLIVGLDDRVTTELPTPVPCPTCATPVPFGALVAVELLWDHPDDAWPREILWRCEADELPEVLADDGFMPRTCEQCERTIFYYDPGEMRRPVQFDRDWMLCVRCAQNPIVAHQVFLSAGQPGLATSLTVDDLYAALNGDTAEFFRVLQALLRADRFVETEGLYRSVAVYTGAVSPTLLRPAVTRWLRTYQTRLDPNALPAFARLTGLPLVCDQCAALYQIDDQGLATHCDVDGAGRDHDADADHVPTGLALFFDPEED